MEFCGFYAMAKQYNWCASGVDDIHLFYCKLSANSVYILPVSYSDVALVTSLRDGMNLVSYEFVACQDKKKGVLILSEVITETS